MTSDVHLRCRTPTNPKPGASFPSQGQVEARKNIKARNTTHVRRTLPNIALLPFSYLLSASSFVKFLSNIITLSISFTPTSTCYNLQSPIDHENETWLYTGGPYHMSQPLPSLMASGIRISNHKRRILDAISRQIGEKVRVV